MESLSQLVSKARQAPWRVQRQWVGALLLLVVLSSMVAAIRIEVTARAGIYGRQIQILSEQIETANQFNANKEVELARLTSAEAMQQRARGLGFEPATSDQITYVVVPGFREQDSADLSTPGSETAVSSIKPEYRETLFDWFTRQISATGE